MALKTLTFAALHAQLIRRTGRDTDSPTVADYPEMADMLNLRLQECWDYPGAHWDFLKVVDTVEFLETDTYRYIDISDGQTIFGVYAEDPRENFNAVQLRTNTFEAGKLRLQADAPDECWYIYYPERPDWVADDPVPAVYDLFRAPALALAYADVLRTEGGVENMPVADREEKKGYRLLDELCLRYTGTDLQSRVNVRRAIPGGVGTMRNLPAVEE